MDEVKVRGRECPFLGAILYLKLQIGWYISGLNGRDVGARDFGSFVLVRKLDGPCSTARANVEYSLPTCQESSRRVGGRVRIGVLPGRCPRLEQSKAARSIWSGRDDLYLKPRPASRHALPFTASVGQRLELELVEVSVLLYQYWTPSQVLL